MSVVQKWLSCRAGFSLLLLLDVADLSKKARGTMKTVQWLVHRHGINSGRIWMTIWADVQSKEAVTWLQLEWKTCISVAKVPNDFCGRTRSFILCPQLPATSGIKNSASGYEGTCVWLATHSNVQWSKHLCGKERLPFSLKKTATACLLCQASCFTPFSPVYRYHCHLLYHLDLFFTNHLLCTEGSGIL